MYVLTTASNNVVAYTIHHSTEQFPLKGRSHIRCAELRVAVLRCAVRELVATFYRPLCWDALR